MKNFLPLGSIVKIKDVSKKALIFGRLQKKENSENEEIFDYIGCMYPEGNVALNKSLLFNHDDIDELIFLGYQDAEELNIRKLLAQEYEKSGINHKDD